MAGNHPDPILFDLDGVLVDSWGAVCHAFDSAYRLAGLPGKAPIEALSRSLGRPIHLVLRELELPPAMEVEFERVSVEMAAEIRLYDGIMEMLVTLERSGHPIGIVTGKPRSRTIDVLTRTGVLPFVKGLTVGNEGLDKPSPRAIWHCLEEIGVGQSAVAYVGDSAVDLETARNAGIPFFFATWGAQWPLNPNGCSQVLKHPSEIIRFIQQ
jgi:AHBA synthesis associated protein